MKTAFVMLFGRGRRPVDQHITRSPPPISPPRLDIQLIGSNGPEKKKKKIQIFSVFSWKRKIDIRDYFLKEKQILEREISVVF